MKLSVIFLTAVLIFAGCAGLTSKETSLSKDEFSLARSLIDQVFLSYMNYSRDEFNRLISSEFKPVRSEFLNTIEENFYKGNIEEMSHFVEQVIVKDGLLAAAFKWEKKTKDYDVPESSNSKGKAEFIFKKENKQWLLYQIKGENPFTK